MGWLGRILTSGVIGGKPARFEHGVADDLAGDELDQRRPTDSRSKCGFSHNLPPSIQPATIHRQSTGRNRYGI